MFTRILTKIKNWWSGTKSNKTIPPPSPQDGQPLHPKDTYSGYLSFLDIPEANTNQFGLFFFASSEGYEFFRLDVKSKILHSIHSPNLWYSMISDSNTPREEKITKIKEQLKIQEYPLTSGEFTQLRNTFEKLKPPLLDYDTLPDDVAYEAVMGGATFIIDYPQGKENSRLYWHGNTVDIFSEISSKYRNLCKEILEELRKFGKS
ncbi:MAG: hypothetical protein AAF518_28950 [Spirochaetota bacterium]